jgi:hypothetical protein
VCVAIPLTVCPEETVSMFKNKLLLYISDKYLSTCGLIGEEEGNIGAVRYMAVVPRYKGDY